jgi:hypothetical protein
MSVEANIENEIKSERKVCTFIDETSTIEYTVTLDTSLSITAVYSSLETYKKWESCIFDPLTTKDLDRKFLLTLTLEKVYELFEGYKKNPKDTNVILTFPEKEADDGSLSICFSCQIPNMGDDYTDKKLITLTPVVASTEEHFSGKLKSHHLLLSNTLNNMVNMILVKNNQLLDEITQLKSEVSSLKIIMEKM